MAEINHRIGIQAPVAKVYQALSTIDGLASWWTSETSGNATVGSLITFSFRNDDGSMKGEFKMEVTQLNLNERVQWRTKSGPPDWVDTELTFSLKQEGPMTILMFSHSKWNEASESLAHCSMKWATFLLSLRSYLEDGKGRPAPHDLKIDNWN